MRSENVMPEFVRVMEPEQSPADRPHHPFRSREWAAEHLVGFLGYVDEQFHLLCANCEFMFAVNSSQSIPLTYRDSSRTEARVECLACRWERRGRV